MSKLSPAAAAAAAIGGIIILKIIQFLAFAAGWRKDIYELKSQMSHNFSLHTNWLTDCTPKYVIVDFFGHLRDNIKLRFLDPLNIQIPWNDKI